MISQSSDDLEYSYDVNLDTLESLCYIDHINLNVHV